MNIIITILTTLLLITVAIYKHTHPKTQDRIYTRTSLGRFKGTVSKKTTIRTLSNKPMKINYYRNDVV